MSDRRPVILQVDEEGGPRPAFEAAGAVLRAGGIVAHPTETFYGLAVDPWNENAVDRLLRLKGRARGKGLILLAGSEEEARELVRPPYEEDYARLASACWPGPLTIVTDPRPDVPAWVLGEDGGVAVRVSSDPSARRLCSAAGHPVTSTSANRSGSPPATSSEELLRAFTDRLDMILDAGRRDPGAPSTVVQIGPSGARVIREGLLSGEEILRALGRAP